nr:PREDICTED: ubiquitin carboxyl-terminal hydrolase 1 [Latimeria chalumnae]|eukprot:XP_006010499.1 PREDICTED: ubiquitin carboxyl-terminal hydrolase 1 [Latimeria chalumnae]
MILCSKHADFDLFAFTVYLFCSHIFFLFVHFFCSCDQAVPTVQSISPDVCEKRENLLPFVGLSNLGNTCYLNSVLQVLYYYPGFKAGMKHLFNIISKKKEKFKSEEDQKDERETSPEDMPASYELVCNLNSLIVSIEKLQISYLKNPEKYTGELATQPRRLLNTLRELNPMYEGYLQHDAQEVLQCILGYIQEVCQKLKEEEKNAVVEGESAQSNNIAGNEINGRAEQPSTVDSEPENKSEIEEQNEPSASLPEEKMRKRGTGKRSSDTEAGNAKKKSKVIKDQKVALEAKTCARSKRKPSGDGSDSPADSDIKICVENSIARPLQKKSRLGLGFFKSSGKQPSILSKFCSLGKLTTSLGHKGQTKVTEEEEPHPNSLKCGSNSCSVPECSGRCTAEISSERIEEKAIKSHELNELELMERLFQGQLVLRTRCLECECFTERREDFQDISVPVQENEPSEVEDGSKISPEPKIERKTLRWAISQFASVERIVGEDKYFCESCHHYTEAERSLLFDKMPDVITIHLKCFAANSSEFDCYGGLSKVNTPLLTPLKLSLGEWSTQQTSDRYELFAAVMHSGITISSGHYTAYVKITDLSHLEGLSEISALDHKDDDIKTEPVNEQGAKALIVEDYDDGEVSFKVNGSGAMVVGSKVSNKKNAEGVGLLGGQKSITNVELSNSKTSPCEKSGHIALENGQSDFAPENSSEDVKECSNQNGDVCNGGISKSQALSASWSLREYEGKWILFDDSEVKTIEEKDLLISLSPNTSSTTTPYLLFYKKSAVY